jgi:hypothetical protein
MQYNFRNSLVMDALNDLAREVKGSDAIRPEDIDTFKSSVLARTELDKSIKQTQR